MIVSKLNKPKSKPLTNRVSPVSKASFINLLSMKKDLYFNKIPWRDHNRSIVDNLDSYGFNEIKYMTLGWLVNSKVKPLEVKKIFGYDLFQIYIRYTSKEKKWVIQELKCDPNRWNRDRTYVINAMVIALIERLTNISYLITNRHKSVFEYHQETYNKSFRNVFYTDDDELSQLWSDLDLLMYTNYEQLIY